MKHDRMTIFYYKFSFTSIYLVRLTGGGVGGGVPKKARKVERENA